MQVASKSTTFLPSPSLSMSESPAQSGLSSGCSFGQLGAMSRLSALTRPREVFRRGFGDGAVVAAMSHAVEGLADQVDVGLARSGRSCRECQVRLRALTRVGTSARASHLSCSKARPRHCPPPQPTDRRREGAGAISCNLLAPPPGGPGRCPDSSIPAPPRVRARNCGGSSKTDLMAPAAN